jgi:hypothetical protein
MSIRKLIEDLPPFSPGKVTVKSADGRMATEAA